MSDKEIRTLLEEMVEMMDCGDEPGAGLDWHTRAKEALSKPVFYVDQSYDLEPMVRFFRD